MFRSARRLTPALHSLLLGSALSAGVLASSLALVGCADENDPATHAKRLSDTVARAAAANRIVQFFEDAMTADGKDRNGPHVKAVLDATVEPMNTLCTTGDLEAALSAKVVKFLADSRDPRAEGCLVKTLKDYKPESNDADVGLAARAAAQMKLKSASAPLLDAFKKLRPSKPKGALIEREVRESMLALADKSWEPDLIAMLAKPIDPKDRKDEVYAQNASAQILGLLKSDKAVRPLIQIMLTPSKADVANTAVNALIKIGKPSVGPAIALLKGEDTELVALSKAEASKAAGDGRGSKGSPDKMHLATAALILGSIGRPEAAAPMIDALASADDLSRTILARELTKLPKSEATVAAFKGVYEKLPLTVDLPDGGGAREALLEAAGAFYDPSLVPWIVKTAKELKGEDSEVDPVRGASLTTALKLMTAEQKKVVDELYTIKSEGPDGKPSTLGKGYEAEYKTASALLAECGSKADCYASKLGEPASQTKEGQFRGIKAGYMTGVYGSPDIRSKIVAAFPTMTNGALRFVSVMVLDALSPKGDPALAATLQKIVDEAEEKKDALKMQGNAPFKVEIFRLQARAQ